MDLGIKRKLAVVTAASAGLGKAVAMELAAEGANVVVNSRNDEALQRAADDIRAHANVEVVPIAGDVTNERFILDLMAAAEVRFGRIDILVTNAGGPPAGFFNNFTADDYRKAIELNLISTIDLCRAAVPLMRQQGWGRIVAIASIAAKQPVDNLILSNTARAGVLGFLKSLANQVAADGITVNTVCPGYHLTDRLKNLAHEIAQKEDTPVEETYASWAESTPMKRLGEPKELAALVAFLCSERASYITGTVTQVDGGAYRGLI